jgi:defect-in-organelle-trafficking protein DotC
MKKIFKKLFVVSALSMATTAVFAQTYPGLNYPKPEVDNTLKQQNPAPTLDQLLSSQITAEGAAANKSEVSEMRRQAIVEIASALGASGGLAYRMGQIRKDVDAQATQLDQLFDFTKMTVSSGVLAPVLTEGLANYSQESPDQVRIADKIYKIEAPAKFVSVYPTWRSYLIFSFPNYDMPSAAYLPKNDKEKAIWDQAVKTGWQQGIEQANNIFEASYNRLERDYKGMIKYKILLAEGLITPTIISKQNLGVTGGGREMAINDQVFRITDHSALNPNKSDWKVEYPVTNNVDGNLK